VSKALLTQNSLALEAQVEERPLAKKQEELQGIVIWSKSCSCNDTSTDAEHTVVSTGNIKAEHPRKALLKNDDVELRRVGTVSSQDVTIRTLDTLNGPRQLLEDVHRQFFHAYDRPSSEGRNKRRRPGNEQPRLSKPYDVTVSVTIYHVYLHSVLSAAYYSGDAL